MPGPKFGSNFGRGLNFSFDAQRRAPKPQLNIAKRMEYRQLIEYLKLTDETKQHMIIGLKWVV